MNTNYKSKKYFVGSKHKNRASGYEVEVVGRLGSEFKYYCKFPCGHISLVLQGNLAAGVFKPSYIFEDVYKTVMSRYKSMRNRCESENNNMYYLYGARGISVEFKTSWDYLFHLITLENFENMLEYPEKYDVDRIDTNGNYKAGNIRIVTKSENLKNRNTYTYNQYVLEVDGIEFTSIRELGDYMSLGDRAGIKKRFKENYNNTEFVFKGKLIKIKEFRKLEDNKNDKR